MIANNNDKTMTVSRRRQRQGPSANHKTTRMMMMSRPCQTALAALFVACWAADTTIAGAFVLSNNNHNNMRIATATTAPLHHSENFHGNHNMMLMRNPLHSLHATATPLAEADASDSVSSNNQKSNTPSYPTHDELTQLLAQTCELRRLKQIETEQRLLNQQKTGDKDALLPRLQICRAAGYGNDLTAYEQALERGAAARDDLITRNMGLVRRTIQRDVLHKGRPLQSLQVDDLMQEGAIGLSRAIDKWDMDIGGTFSCYATYWIRAAVLRSIAQRDDLVRTPVHVSASIQKLTRAAREMGVDSWNTDGNSALWEQAKAAKQLAQAAGLSQDAVERAVQVKRRRSKGGIKSFEAWMQQGKDLVADHGGNDMMMMMEEDGSSASDLEHLRTELAKFLRPKEVEALSWRYGLNRDVEDEQEESLTAATTKTTSKTQQPSQDAKTTATAAPSLTKGGRWGEAMSFVEVGKRMHVSAEYGRRLTKRALDKLRAAHEEGRLEPACLALSY